MFWTVAVIAILVGVLALTFILWALFLRLGLWWANVPGVTAPRVVAATALVSVLQLVVNGAFAVLLGLIAPNSLAAALALSLVQVLALVLVACWSIQSVFKVRFLRSFQAWLPTLVPGFGVLAFVVLVFRPFLFEAFTTPTNAMAPTLLGKHSRGVCPQCGQAAYSAPADDPMAAAYPAPMICENFHVTPAAKLEEGVFRGDRFLVGRFLTPHRWDLMVFRYPGDSSTLYVMRVVGLPGEIVHIEDGAVWVNGNRLTPPESIQGIKYLSEIPEWFGPHWGSKDQPARLAADEYFVLGDFSARAADSRLWQQGAPGHHPYAVPAGYVHGVVTNIYWPPQRWRTLR